MPLCEMMPKNKTPIPAPPRSRPSSGIVMNGRRRSVRPQTPMKLAPLARKVSLSVVAGQEHHRREVGGGSSNDHVNGSTNGDDDDGDNGMLEDILECMNAICEDLSAGGGDGDEVPTPRQNSREQCLKWLHHKLRFVRHHRLNFILAEYSQANEKATATSDELAALSRRLQQAEAATRSLQEQRDTARSELHARNALCDELQQHLTHTRVELARHQQAADKERELHAQELEEIHAACDNDQSNTACMVAKEQVTTAKYATRNAELEHENENLRQQLDTLKQRLEGTIKTHETTDLALRTECDLLRKERANADDLERIQALHQRMDELHEVWKRSMHVESITTKVALHDALGELQRTREQLDMLQQKYEQRAIDVTSMVPDDSILREEMLLMKSAFEVKIEHLKQQVTIKDRTLSKLQHEVANTHTN